MNRNQLKKMIKSVLLEENPPITSTSSPHAAEPSSASSLVPLQNFQVKFENFMKAYNDNVKHLLETAKEVDDLIKSDGKSLPREAVTNFKGILLGFRDIKAKMDAIDGIFSGNETLY